MLKLEESVNYLDEVLEAVDKLSVKENFKELIDSANGCNRFTYVYNSGDGKIVPFNVDIKLGEYYLIVSQKIDDNITNDKFVRSLKTKFKAAYKKATESLLKTNPKFIDLVNGKLSKDEISAELIKSVSANNLEMYLKDFLAIESVDNAQVMKNMIVNLSDYAEKIQGMLSGQVLTYSSITRKFKNQDRFEGVIMALKDFDAQGSLNYLPTATSRTLSIVSHNGCQRFFKDKFNNGMDISGYLPIMASLSIRIEGLESNLLIKSSGAGYRNLLLSLSIDDTYKAIIDYDESAAARMIINTVDRLDSRVFNDIKAITQSGKEAIENVMNKFSEMDELIGHHTKGYLLLEKFLTLPIATEDDLKYTLIV